MDANTTTVSVPRFAELVDLDPTTVNRAIRRWEEGDPRTRGPLPLPPPATGLWKSGTAHRRVELAITALVELEARHRARQPAADAPRQEPAAEGAPV